MAIPAGAARITLSGSLPGGEIWSTGFWMVDVGTASQATADALALTIAGTLDSSDSSGAMRITAIRLMSPATSWKVCRTYLYAGGSDKAEYIGEYTLPTPVAGQGQGLVPDQVALVLSLRTARPGRSYRGRMYLPATGCNFVNGGEASNGDTDPVCAAWGTAFSDINASSAGKVVVVSSTAGVATDVNRVLMDTRADIQRRRANRETINAVSSADVNA